MQMEEITEATDWKSLFFHSIKSGSYAVAKNRSYMALEILLKILILVSGALKYLIRRKGVMANVLLRRTVIKTTMMSVEYFQGKWEELVEKY